MPAVPRLPHRPSHPPVMRAFLRDRALSSLFFALFALALAGATIAGWVEYAADQAAHGAPPELLGTDGYLPTLLEQTSQNWQSEFLALAVIVVLSSRLIHRESAHSRDGQDEVAARVRAVRRRVERLEAR